MNLICRGITSLVLCFSASLAFATFVEPTPKNLITHNLTDVQSNAYVNVQAGKGSVPSAHPTNKNSNGSVAWYLVRAACYLYAKNDLCEAEIRMATDTPNPISLGVVT